ncbi:MAG: adenylate/guanylate cyclase domain-containing protein [Desulfobacteraceae bacterium]|nr:adenylate/guanylate cyclase domain-containing protein [Desulfobacteraceae bacterium]
MSLKLKSKKLLKLICFISMGLLAVVFIVLFAKGNAFYELDYKVLDLFYKKVVTQGYGPIPSDSPQIKYVTINDETYSFSGNNFLDRSYLAKVNSALSELDIQAAAYDIIFSRPTSPSSDEIFKQSIENLGSVYLPIGLKMADIAEPFVWGKGEAYEKFQGHHLKRLEMLGSYEPVYGSWALMQYNPLADAAYNSGHISSYTDSDGTSRHMVMVIKVDDQFFPCLALSMYLDYVGVPFEKIIINWGNYIRIPSTKESFLDEDVLIPIDKRGRAFIPFWQTWQNGFEEMPAHILLETMKDKNLSGNLLEIFEGSFVFIGDISMGISDLGNTPLQKDVPLITTHTAMLNAMLTQQFYTKWSFGQVLGTILLLGTIFGISALFKPSWFLYVSGVAIFSGIIFLTGFQFLDFRLFPIATVGTSCFFIVAGLIISVEIVTSRDRKYIRNVFARYVPEKVVNQLLMKPELLKMGGETREISLMMSDLRGFTALAASQTPEDVIKILNRYFEKMVEIILDHRGIIDEFIGDGMLIFFGAPEPMEDHRGMAVACALSMQAAMEGINLKNQADGLPSLDMGIGINTGEVILGNIGSERRAKYGAVGSEVNFTGRTESFTVGGQVLITQSTYERLSNLLQVHRVMEVEMKGLPEKVSLYDVIGIKGTYNVLLPQKEEMFIELENKINIIVYKLDAKIIGKSEIPAVITHLSEKSAKIIIQESFKEFENIKMHFPNLQTHKEDEILNKGQAEAYAKVMSTQKMGNEYKTTIYFTSVSKEADHIFQIGRTHT